MENKNVVPQAKMLVYGQDGEEMIFPMNTSDLKIGDLIQVEEGERIPTDFKILVGELLVEKDQQEITFSKGNIAVAPLLVKKGKAKGYVFSAIEDAVYAKKD
jgi:P-type Cu+ transporter